MKMDAKAAWWWVGAWVVVGLYVVGYGVMLERYRAVPYWDEAGYVGKTYSLVEKWEAGGAGRFNPGRYLGAQPAERGGLMMVLPAIFFGKEATGLQVGMMWMAERVGLLMLGVWLLAKMVGDGRWVFAAVCVVLGGHWFLSVNPNGYLMDLPCAAGMVVCVAMGGMAIKRRGVWWAVGLGGAVVGAVLIKPQAAVVGGIVVGVVMAERIFWERGFLRRSGGWWMVFVGLAGVMAGIFFSAYGRAVRRQWALGSQGYWGHSWSGREVMDVVVGMMPGWMMAGVIACVVWWVLRKKKIGGTEKWLAGMVVVSVGGWLVFSVGLAYAVDPRVVWMMMPVCVCGGAMVLCWNKVGRWVASGVGAVMFLLGMGVAVFGWPVGELPVMGYVLGPRVVEQSGSSGFLYTVTRDIGMQAGDGEVEVLVNEEFVEVGALQLAGRWDKVQGRFVAGPFGDGEVDAGKEFVAGRFYLTVENGGVPAWGLPERATADVRGMTRVIAEEGSPVHGAFEQVAIFNFRRPVVGMEWVEPVGGETETRGEQLVLWRMKRELTAEEVRTCGEYLRVKKK